jgi:hypothetical protein
MHFFAFALLAFHSHEIAVFITRSSSPVSSTLERSVNSAPSAGMRAQGAVSINEIKLLSGTESVSVLEH